ncbi:MAG: AbrB/MazE/SpoVT family DNA-binding domain-containing protein [Promethearchaeota archaeon]
MMEKIKTALIQIGDSRGIRIPQHIIERLNFHDNLELIIDEVAQQIHIKSFTVEPQELEQIIPIIPQIKEDDTLPLIKAKVVSNPDFNPWDD